MTKMRKYLSNKNLLLLYYAFFYYHVLYGILSATKSAIMPIQILQNKAIRITNNSTWKDQTNSYSLFLKYNILKIKDIYKFELSKFMYLFHINALPEIFDTYFLSTEHAHYCNTRSKSNQNYFLKSIRTNSGKNLIQFYGVQLWNRISLAFKSFSFYRFKKEYAKILLDNYNI